MNLKSQKGYSLIEVGVGLVIITIFMICGVTMLRGTYSTYRLVEQKNMAMSYLIKSIERELIEGEEINITENPADTVIEENSEYRKVVVTNIPASNMKLTTVLEILPSKNGKSYEDSQVKLLTSTIEFYIRKNDESSKRELTLQTLKIGGDGLGT